MLDESGNPLDDYALGIYLRELKRQSIFALHAYSQMQLVLTARDQAVQWVFDRKQEINKIADEEEEVKAIREWTDERMRITSSSSIWMYDFWCSVQAFLVSVANISKLLWPSELKRRGETEQQADKRKNRGRQLRQVLGKKDDSVIESRSFRNSFEHFDERLDSWVDLSSRHNFMDEYIGPAGGVTGLDRSDMMRTYDPASNTFTFQGTAYELSPVLRELTELVLSVERVDSERSARLMVPPCKHCGFPVAPGEPRCLRCGKEL